LARIPGSRIAFPISAAALAACLTALASPTLREGGFGTPVLLCNLQNRKVNESSGLVVSRRTPGVFWTHNDSGDGPNLFATDRKGRSLGRFTVTGATNVDWEDIAAGPQRSESATLYVGDIGDNGGNRNDTAVYRVREPKIDPAKLAQTGETAPAERLPFRYADGHHDAETLLVDPRSEDILIVTKTDSGISGVYKFPMPLTPGRTATLQKVASLTFANPLRFRGRAVGKLATGGDISADRNHVAIRTYTDGFEWDIRPGQDIDDALRTTPRTFGVPWLGQFESLCYSLDGRFLYTTSEGAPCPLWEIPRTGK
jgi:hypothetical protein